MTAAVLARVIGVLLVLASFADAAGGNATGHIPGESHIFVDGTVLITNPADESVRILMSFPGLDSLQGHEVHIARLVLPPLSVPEGLTLQAHRITAAWDSSTVSWSTPWETPGGDYDRTSHGEFHVRSGRSEDAPIWLNVSRQVYEIVNEGASNYGFIITPPENVALGFASASALHFSGLDSTRLVVVCGD